MVRAMRVLFSLASPSGLRPQAADEGKVHHGIPSTGCPRSPAKAPQASQARPVLRTRTPLSLRDISPRSGESPHFVRSLSRGLRPRNKPPLTGEVAERQRWPEGLYRVHSTSNLSPSISTYATASGSMMS